MENNKIEDQTERTIAKSVIEELKIATPSELDIITIYKDGISILDIKDTFVKPYIKKYANETILLDAKGKNPKKYRLSISRQNMIIDFIKSLTYCSLKDFDSNDRIINVENGLYFLDGYKVVAKKEESDGFRETNDGERIYYKIKHFKQHKNLKKPYKSFIQIPVNYDPGAENLEIDQILVDIVGFEDVKLIYEMMGYFLASYVKFSKAFMLYGETGTGKTTIINIIRQFFGKQNISGVELQKLDDPFQIEKTRNKLINIFDDLSSKPIKFVGNFKGLVTNSSMRGSIKHVQGEIEWDNRCKGLFACNTLPTIKDYLTNAFYKRWVLIPCYEDFKEKGKEDTNIRDKKYSEGEKSGLLNKLLQALKRLEERKNFPEVWQDIEFVKNHWNMDINPVKLFVDDNCEIGEESYELDKGLLLTELNKYREKKQVKPIKQNSLTRSLNKLDMRIGRPIKVNKQTKSIVKFPSGDKYKYIRFKEEYKMSNLKPNLNNILNINKEIMESEVRNKNE